MKRHSLAFLVLVVLAIAAVACGEIPTQEPSPGGPTAVPGTPKSTIGRWPDEAQPLIDRVIADAAEQAQVTAAEVEVIKFTEEEWRNSCLGCAPKGKACLDVITPGYRVVVRAGGNEYDYHTDKQDNFILCPSADTAPRDWGKAQPLVDKVVEDLAGRLSVSKDKITVVQVEEKQWPDSSLGCPQPGQMYLTVITPGYQIILEAEGKQYDYRTDTEAHVILCEQKKE